MKKAIFGMMVALSVSAHAYDPNLDAKQAMEELKKIDCSKSLNECRYYSTIEYLSFFNGCQNIISKKMGREFEPEEKKEFNDILAKWSILKDEKLKNAVLEAKNPLKEKLNGDIAKYLERIPTHELMMECERVGLISKDAKPEEMSDILQKTINYQKWISSKFN